nr:uncharacterized protein LOC113807398 [Penaeus vannamei]
MAQKFEVFVKSDPRFEIPTPRHLGMVVFRLKGENELTEKLLKKMNSSGKLHCVPACLKGKYVIRFTVTSTYTTVEDLSRDWAIIRATASEVLSKTPAEEQKTRVFLKDTRKNPDFGTSLLLANSPMSPKIVNGSFAAIFDNNDVLFEFAKKLQQLKFDVKDSPGKAMRKRIKGMLMAGKQYSLDSRMDLVTTLVSSARPGENMPTMRENSVELQDFQEPGVDTGEGVEGWKGVDTGEGVGLKVVMVHAGMRMAVCHHRASRHATANLAPKSEQSSAGMLPVQTEGGYSPSRGRSRSVDDGIVTPDLKSLELDEAIAEGDGESSSPEGEVNHRSQALNGNVHASICHKCGSAIAAQLYDKGDVSLTGILRHRVSSRGLVCGTFSRFLCANSHGAPNETIKGRFSGLRGPYQRIFDT